MNGILLSVIIPMYNAAPWISECLQSLLVPPKFWPLLEVIVVDDGSTDGCEKTAQKAAADYPKLFSVIHKTNGGHGSAVNAGIHVCRGRYVKVLDADDWFLTGELCGLLEELGQMGGPEVVFCPFRTFDRKTGRQSEVRALLSAKPARTGAAPAEKERGPADTKAAPTQQAACRSQILTMEQLVGAWRAFAPILTFHGILYRRDFYLRLGKKLPEGVFYDDGFYVIAAASHAQKIGILDRCLYVYRIGNSAQSVSAKNRVLRLGDAKEVILSVCRTMGENRSAAGQEYWRRKVCSFLADYFVTCFLRFDDKRAGRREAKKFRELLKKEFPVLEQMMRKKYFVLQAMGYLHINERQFERLLRMRR